MPMVGLICMENKENQNLNKIIVKGKSPIAGIVHVILFHNYSIFLLAVVLGVVLDGLFKYNIFNAQIYESIGLIMIILGPALVYWAQSSTTSYKGEPGKERGLDFFLRGPYRYTRNPTNLGVTIMSLGLGFLLKSPISILFILITYLVSRFIFIKKQDLILEEKYGIIFNDYKKKVRDWL